MSVGSPSMQQYVVLAAKPESPRKMRVPKKCRLELCPRRLRERAAALLRERAAGLPGAAMPGSEPQAAGRAVVLRAAGALPGPHPTVFSLYAAVYVPSGMSSRRSVVCARVKLVCTFILEFPAGSGWYCNTDSYVLFTWCDCWCTSKLLGVLLHSAFYQNDFVDVNSLHGIPIMG